MESEFLWTASSIFFILLLSAFMMSICRRIKIPFAVGLLFMGMGLAYIEKFYPLPFLTHINFSPEIVLYVFLPTLIFEASYHLNYRQFQGLFREISMLAVVGLLVATFVTGAGMHYLVDMPWTVALLFGAFISATDPVAVLAIFKELKAPKRLSTIVDGESLLNDAAALVFFQFFLKIALAGSFVFSFSIVGSEVLEVFLSVFNGVLVGGVLGFIFSIIIGKTSDSGVKMTLGLVLAHATFILAEGVLNHKFHIPASGILATMTAGIIMGTFGRRRLSIKSNQSFKDIWTFLGFVSNALIFVLLGIKIGGFDLWFYKETLLVAIFVTLFLSRPIAVFLSFFITNLTRKSYQQVNFQDQFVTFWGGMRGALAATAVLLIPVEYPYAELLQVLTGGVIVASFVINAMSIGLIMKWLKIVDFTSQERLQHYEAEIIIDEKISSYLDEIYEKRFIPFSAYQKLKQQYDNKKITAEKDLDKWKYNHEENAREIEKVLLQFALGIEKDVYENLLRKQEISDDRFLVFEQSLERQKDALDRDILPEERKKTGPKTAPVLSDDVCKKDTICYKIPLMRDFSEKLFYWKREKRIYSRLQHYRARKIASWKVVEEMRQLMENELFQDSNIVQAIIDRYLGWHQNAMNKMNELEEEYPEILDGVRLRMAKNVCIKRYRYFIKDFCKKGFLCDKVFTKMWDDVETRR